MATHGRSLTALLGGGLLLGATTTLSAKTSCHVHPPAAEASDGASASTTIGPYDSRDRCEQARHAHFGPLGRCHCSAGFTPGWVGGEPGDAPMPSGRPSGTALP